jgi:hypothetical protein
LLILCIFAFLGFASVKVVRFALSKSDNDLFSYKNKRAERIFESGLSSYDEVSEYLDNEDKMFYW